MKTKHFFLALLFAALSTALFAQVRPQNFQQEKNFIDRHQQMHVVNFGLNSPTNDNIEPFDERHRHHAGRNAFIPVSESWEKSRSNDDIVYVCDSAFGYSIEGEQTKTTYTHDSKGRTLTELLQTWDTGYEAWVNTSQALFTYTDTYYLSQLYQEWDIESETWVNDIQLLFSHYSSGKMRSYTYQNWDKVMEEWVYFDKYNYTYDDAGNTLSILYQYWDTEMDNWSDTYKKSFTFDDSGNRLSLLYQYDETETGDLINKYLYNYTYDDDGNMLTELRQNWDNYVGDWTKRHLFSISYDEAGNMVKYLKQVWDYVNWINESLNSYTYDDSGNLLSELRQNWNWEIDIWYNSSLNLYSYDDSANTQSVIYQKWEAGNNEWRKSIKISSSFDAPGNMLSELHQSWNAQIEEWANVWKNEYKFDYVEQNITGAFYEWSQEWIPSDISYIYIFLFNKNLFYADNSYKAEVWYSSYSLGIEDKDIQSKGNTTFCIPNPANDLLNVSNHYKKEANLKIYNISGQLINEKLLSKGQNQVSVQNLSPGIYLFVLQSENSRIQNKVVVY